MFNRLVLLTIIPFLICAVPPGWTEEGIEIFFVRCVVNNSSTIVNDTTYNNATAVPEFCFCLTSLVSVKFTQNVAVILSQTKNTEYEKTVRAFATHCFKKMGTYKQ